MSIQRPRFALTTLATATAVFTIATSAAPPAHAQGAPGVRLSGKANDTGLTRCTRDFSTFTTDCAGTGQDAEFGRDVARPGNANGHAGFAFQKVCNSGEFAGTGTCSKDAVLGSGADDWACTYDQTTGLEWEVKTADGGLRDRGNRYTNVGDDSSTDASGYVTAANAQGLCGAGDWRLPTTYELQGLDDFDRASPHSSIDPKWFPNSPAERWWAAEGYFGQEATAGWVVSTLMDPSNINVVGLGRTEAVYVRLVRVPQAQSRVQGSRFVANAAGDEITDRVAKLVWRRCVEGMYWDGTTCSGHAHVYTFGDALAHANAVAAEKGKPWRVPNAKELHGITSKTTAHPAIDPTMFPNTPAEHEWTSTAYAWTATGGWLVNFDDANVLAYFNRFKSNLRLVRDAD